MRNEHLADGAREELKTLRKAYVHNRFKPGDRQDGVKAARVNDVSDVAAIGGAFIGEDD